MKKEQTRLSGMTKRRRFKSEPSSKYVTHHSFVSPTGRRVHAGMEVSIQGQRGRFRVIWMTEWLSSGYKILYVQESKGLQRFREFPLDSIKTVHVPKKTKYNSGE